MANLPKGRVSHKTAAAGAGGVISTVIVWAAFTYLDLELDANDVALFVGMLVSIGSFATSYVKRLSVREVSLARTDDGAKIKSQPTPEELAK
jgi:hypothetical protein